MTWNGEKKYFFDLLRLFVLLENFTGKKEFKNLNLRVEGTKLIHNRIKSWTGRSFWVKLIHF